MAFKISKYITLILFCAIIILPFALSDKSGGKASVMENRMLAEAPEFTKGKPFAKMREETEHWLNDNAGGRSFATKLDSVLQYYLWRRSADKNVMLGSRGWTYFFDPLMRSRYIGEDYPSANELEEYNRGLYDMQQFVTNRGADFLFVAIPDKRTVYSEYFPKSIIPAEESFYDVICNNIEEDGRINFLNLKSALIVAKETENAYIYPQSLDNSHWNELGMYVALKEIYKHLSVKNETLENCEIKQVPVAYNFFNLVPVNEQLLEVTPRTQVEIMDCSSYLDKFPKLASSHNVYRYKSNVEAPSVLVVGDSYFFGSKRIELLAKMSSEMTFINYTTDVGAFGELMDDLNPDIVILEAVERQIETALIDVRYVEYQ